MDAGAGVSTIRRRKNSSTGTTPVMADLTGAGRGSDSETGETATKDLDSETGETATNGSDSETGETARNGVAPSGVEPKCVAPSCVAPNGAKTNCAGAEFRLADVSDQFA